MISRARSVSIYAGDQDRAKEFWTQTIGFDLIQDTPMGPDEGTARWIEVAPPDRNIILVLFTVDEQRDRIGTFSNVLFECDDVQQTYQELTAKGVEFPEPPRQEFWGWWATFSDPDGNTYGLGQREQ